MKRVIVEVKRVSYTPVEFNVTDEDYEMLLDGDLSPMFENDDAMDSYIYGIQDASEELATLLVQSENGWETVKSFGEYMSLQNLLGIIEPCHKIRICGLDDSVLGTFASKTEIPMIYLDANITLIEPYNDGLKILIDREVIE